MVGHLLAWEMHERDGSWHAWVSIRVQDSGSGHAHKMVDVSADSLQPLEPLALLRGAPARARQRQNDQTLVQRTPLTCRRTCPPGPSQRPRHGIVSFSLVEAGVQ